jgi:methylenetetrahydrofolate reductase (NADPH)
MEFNPPLIDVTTSREEHVYVDNGNGLLDRKITRSRPGTLGICAAIKHKFDVDTVPHVLCGGFTKEETEYLLVDCDYLGIQNVMALRGDSMAHQKFFEPSIGGHNFATELVSQIKDLNSGKYLHGVIETNYKSDFCIGVAGYPEKHFESPSLQTDLKHLKEKVDAGADYIVTQMFFNNEDYFNFVDECRKAEIIVPIIPGLKILNNPKQLTSIPKNFYVNIPTELSEEIEENPDYIHEIGVNWCIKQCEELLNNGVMSIHYYIMSGANAVTKVLKELNK